MKNFIQGIFDLLKTRITHGIETSNPSLYQQLLQINGPDLFASTLGISRQKVKSGVYQGGWADCPWIAVYSRNTNGAQTGYYVVYLFAADGSRVYLSFNQGIEGIPPVLIEKRREDLKVLTECVPGINTEQISLSPMTKSERPRKYEMGNVCSYMYEDGRVPENEVLIKDFKSMYSLLQFVEYTNFKLHIQDPKSLFIRLTSINLKLLEEKAKQYHTSFYIGIHEENKEIVDVIIQQLFNKIPTYVNFHHPSQSWSGVIKEVLQDRKYIKPSKVINFKKTSLTPAYYIHICLLEKVQNEFMLNKLLLPRQRINQQEILALNSTNNNYSLSYERYDFVREMQRKTNLELEFIEDLKETLLRSGQIILAGPPGTGKTLVAEELGRIVAGVANVKVIQFHPSYTYEEFVEGLRPKPGESSLVFIPSPGALLKWAEKARNNEHHKFILIIDEMNRANLPKVFGELFYLLEYRNRKIDLQYSESYELPDNLYIIGTMNTVDRNIRTLDYALRRRFEIFEIKASPILLKRYYDMPENSLSVPNLVEGFIQLNENLRREIDRHHEIGHAYFMRRGDFTREDLRKIWERKVFPIIEEYLFDLRDEEIHTKFNLEKFWPEVPIYGTDRDNPEED
ncbi:MrcB family domain-containing protein [Priestia aryabhattai]|uniref:MrcB family domain-containing protein n=1 Tax=Priestia aryabhattai TaxID=412384 RepID=UPI001FB3D576|nr:DUF3578 domain-containing protein [Priestia aryabhattai]